ncbi:phosphoribosyl 1,2-cyclic phosphate phosphodiesterase [Arboricoccus pini]|uniref:Phosphoribosyl 1,2-cyclic phosphate phosphodiesterase n=1 Tax=Arboricoccus pini TaxID=1963835 RepID=A0A212PWU2_9PROT|nr:MBL fold metallo-hydrolase [Arboricoccus pini]SNB51499.1 phosphoribosyl 1,2-cyclic phosphate phosphodiesterase [Arboricoccus pini]
MKVTILGCGTSAGVPQIGCRCPVCTSPDRRNKRRRQSIFVETGEEKILFDTGPDLRMQCVDAGIDRVTGLIYTHAHADHVHGIDDLRSINNVMMTSIDAYAHQSVFDRIRHRFDYAFEGGRDAFGYFRPEITPHPIKAGPFQIGEVEIRAFRQRHGKGESWGFRIGDFAYSTDTDWLDDAALAVLEGVEVWVVDALRDRPHPSHAHLELALSWVERLRPRLTYLTHMNHEVDYADWAARLPPHVRPAHDGLVIEL